ncbi:GNAT family N-acetyltransferase [Cohnella sp. LGH]|uniref:Acetyltransferase (GNAT) family protein n=1 Tax=Cohnella phaseoli TaxID=456490 RepID=A0A3D9IU08_9BACL|nr:MULTISPECIES: GNAT family N-acetyltransferase [Cohnella]QTH45668.1 GNAT family N-acetyltransferase [Cohnella sp. LGH]RED65185.1 acetyltransferase (GNAT) family protein [Cohnella phaseoli]
MSIFTSVERAEPEDTTEIMRLLANTAEWLLRKGSTQWNALLRGEDSHNTPEAVNRGEVYIFRDDGKIAGMVILMEQPNSWDRHLWAGKAEDGAAIYLHRLAVNRKYAGRDVGKQIMQWTESFVPEQLHKGIIRLDCLSSIPALNEFYRNLNYDFVGEGVNSSGTYSMYEKKL